MVQLIWTEPALQDLEEIAEYIAVENVGAAKRLVRDIFDSVSRLKDHPSSGRLVPELSGDRYREVIIGPCRVFYRSTEKAVYVLHVMRGERQLRNYILSDRG